MIEIDDKVIHCLRNFIFPDKIIFESNVILELCRSTNDVIKEFVKGGV